MNSQYNVIVLQRVSSKAAQKRVHVFTIIIIPVK